MILILCGFSSSGKTTFGEMLAAHLGISFFDTDRLLLKRFATPSVRDLFAQIGEEAFRKEEQETLFSLRPGSSSVIATGGGTLVFEENRAFLKTLGKSIYLKTSSATLFTRVLSKGIPAFLDRNQLEFSFNQLIEQRFPIYEQHCDHVIETDALTKMEIFSKLCRYYG